MNFIHEQSPIPVNRLKTKMKTSRYPITSRVLHAVKSMSQAMTTYQIRN